MPPVSKRHYHDNLRQLQAELVKLQRHFIECNEKILIIFEGRDAAGKDESLLATDRTVVFKYDASSTGLGRLAK